MRSSIWERPLHIDDRKTDDVFEVPGFAMRRQGRFIEIDTHRSPEEHEELRRQMWESRPVLLEEIRTASEELVGIIHKYTSLDVVANLWLRNCIHDPDEYVEWKSPLGFALRRARGAARTEG